MRFFTRLAIYFYVIVITVFSSSAILFVSHTVGLRDINYYLSLTYHDESLRMLVGFSAAAFILISTILAKIIFGSEQKERTIAFDNPSGRVSISLSTVEELVRHLMSRVPEVKEVKPNIIASKRGIEIEARLILRSDVNIPEMTEKLQDLTKNKIQDILGVKETVTVRIHVTKIISDSSKEKSKRDKQASDEDQEPAVPFQGYRA